MKNKLIKNKKIIFSISFILLIFLIITFQQSQNNSVDNKVFSEKVEKIISQKQEIIQKPTISEKTGKTDSNKIVESEVTKIQPKEYSVVAEEILYPDEYDFGDSISTIITAIGKPVKIDILPLIKAKIGDTIELEFSGKKFSAEIFEVYQDIFSTNQTDEGKGRVTAYSFDSYIDSSIKKIYNNQIHGNISYNKDGIIDGEIRIQDMGGDYVIHIYKQVAYYALEAEWQQEFDKQGYSID
jgi:hypothetical protein